MIQSGKIGIDGGASDILKEQVSFEYFLSLRLVDCSVSAVSDADKSSFSRELDSV